MQGALLLHRLWSASCTFILSQLDARVSEFSREKSDLESRVEEDQDEIDELLEKQRSHISQMSTLQSQLADANIQIEELQEHKLQLEGKVMVALIGIFSFVGLVSVVSFPDSLYNLSSLIPRLTLQSL